MKELSIMDKNKLRKFVLEIVCFLWETIIYFIFLGCGLVAISLSSMLPKHAIIILIGSIGCCIINRVCEYFLNKKSKKDVDN